MVFQWCRNLLSFWDDFWDNQHPDAHTPFAWTPRNILAIAAACVVTLCVFEFSSFDRLGSFTFPGGHCQMRMTSAVCSACQFCRGWGRSVLHPPTQRRGGVQLGTVCGSVPYHCLHKRNCQRLIWLDPHTSWVPLQAPCGPGCSAHLHPSIAVWH